MNYKCHYCPYNNNDEWELRRHMMTKFHENNIRIVIGSERIPLYSIRIDLTIKKRKIGIFKCLFCDRETPERSTIMAHIASYHSENIEFNKDGIWKKFEKDLPKPRIKKITYAKQGNFPEILRQFSSLADNQDLLFIGEDKVRLDLQMKKGEKCCDGSLHFSSCDYALIEDKGKNITKAIKQLRNTGKFVKNKGNQIKLQIIVAPKIGGLANKIFSAPKNILIEKATNKVFYVNDLPVIFINHGDNIAKVIEQIEHLIEW